MSERGSIRAPEVGGEQSDFTDSPGVATETSLAVLGHSVSLNLERLSPRVAGSGGLNRGPGPPLSGHRWSGSQVRPRKFHPCI